MPIAYFDRRPHESDHRFALMELPLKLRKSGIEGMPARRFTKRTGTRDVPIQPELAKVLRRIIGKRKSGSFPPTGATGIRTATALTT